MDNFLSDFCRDNNLNYTLISQAFDGHFRNTLQPMVFEAVKYALEQQRETFKADLVEVLSSATLVQGKAPKVASGGKSRSADYAPHREQFVCRVFGKDISDNKVHLQFQALGGSGFTHELILTQDEIVKLFYDVAEKTSEIDERETEPDWETATVKDTVSRAIPDCSDIMSNYTNIVKYTFVLDVKRKVAKTHSPVELVSVTPCGVFKDDNTD